MPNTYNGNPPPVRISYQYAASVYGNQLPEVLELLGPGYRIWEFFFGYADISFMTEDYFWNGFDVGLQRGDVIIIKTSGQPVAVAVTSTIVGGASQVTSDVTGFLTELRTTPIDFSPSYGDLQTNWSSGSPTFASGGVLNDVNPCPDKAGVAILVAQFPGKAADPVATATITGLSLQCNMVENIVLWMKGTARVGDAIATQYPYRVYVGVGGFTKYSNCIGLLPADGNWHALILNKNNFTSGAGGFSWDSTDIITTIRVKPTDVAENGAVGYNTAAAGENNFLGPIRTNPRARAKALIRFDDSIGDLVQPVYFNTFTLPDGTPAPPQGWSALTLLNHYGFRGTCAHLPRYIGTANNITTFATWEDLKILKQNGWANCFQSYYNPVNFANDGIRLLGPDGYAARTVASVDTSANTITASAITYIPTSGSYNGYPMMFAGTNLPAPLVINKIYWAVATSATAFQLYASEADAINQVNVIDLTTTGTPANFTWRYGFSANDYTKYTEDWDLGMKLLSDNGYSEEAKYLFLNQGATDGKVMTLSVEAGIKAVFGIYKGATAGEFYASYPWTENGGTNPALNWTKQMRMVGAIQTDTTGAITPTDAREYVRAGVAQGSWISNFHHRITNQNGPCLAAYLDELKKFSDAGQLDVITATELPLA